MSAVLIDNRQASFNYEILDTLEAGVVLLGYEVKALKAKKGSLRGAFVSILPDGAYLKSADIPPYQMNNTPKDYDQKRDRRLLFKKKELAKLVGTEKEKGLTLIPISLYSKGSRIKVEVAIARGKKKRDKRQSIKEREEKRHIERTMKYGS